MGIRTKCGVGNVRRPKRKYIALSGRIPNDLRFVVHNNSLINITRALIERVFFVQGNVDGEVKLVPPPATSRAYFFTQMNVFAQKVKTELSSVRRMCLDKFVETSPPHKKKVYANAKKTYLEKGLAPREATVTSFIKAEKVRITNSKPDPAPRIIQPRGVVFNLIFGCFIRPAEKEIYKAIDRVFDRPTVCCGQNAVEMASMLRDAWDEIHDPVAISLDLSRMDQHVSAVALSWEHSFYRHLFRDDPCYDTLDWCLQSTIRNSGRCYVNDQSGHPYQVKYAKVGSRMSGDMNTSLGNKLIMCGLLHSYYSGVCGMVPRRDFNVVDNGDDCVVIVSRQAYARYLIDTGQQAIIRRMAIVDPENWQDVRIGFVGEETVNRYLKVEDWFHTMGFTLKVEGVVSKFNHIDFCQTRPCFIDGRWIMVRTLKALGKDAYCLKPLEILDRWMSQVKTGGMNTYGSVPIFGPYYSSLPGHEDGSRDLLWGTGMYYLSRDMRSSSEITDENRYNFWDTFGVTPREQEVIEQVYTSMLYTRGPLLQNYPNVLLPLPII